MRKIFKSIAIIASLIVLVVFLLGEVVSSPQNSPGLIYAEGGIEVDFETDDWPFYETSFLPGDKAVKQVIVSNISSKSQRVGLRLDHGVGSLLPRVLWLTVRDSQTGRRLIWQRSLLSFYHSTQEYRLFTLRPDEERQLEIEIQFSPGAGKIYQGESTTFDLSIGFIGRPGLPRPTRPPRPTLPPRPTRPPRP